MLAARLFECRLRCCNTPPGTGQRTLAVGAVLAYLCSPEHLDPLNGARCGGVGAGSGSSPLEMLLQERGLLQHLQQVSLRHTCGREKRPAIEAQPARAIWGAVVHDLGRAITAKHGIRSA